jgi:hypothetical protein
MLDNRIIISNFTSRDKAYIPENYKFFNTDDEQKFIKNCKSLDPMLSNWKYRDLELNYSMNNIGMRVKHIDTDEHYITEDYDWSDKILLLGCSQVQGLGVRYEDTIGETIAKQTSMKVINWGVSASGPDTVFTNAMWVATQRNRPYRIIILWPESSRFYYFCPNSKQAIFYAPNIPSMIKNIKNYFTDRYLVGDVQGLHLHYYKDVLKNVYGDKMIEFNIFNSEKRYYLSTDEKKFLKNIYEEHEHCETNTNYSEYLNKWFGRDISIVDNMKQMNNVTRQRNILGHAGSYKNKLIGEFISNQL